MSTFIRRYSKYLNEKSLAYRLIASDITKVKRGSVSLICKQAILKYVSTLIICPLSKTQLYFKMLISQCFSHS